MTRLVVWIVGIFIAIIVALFGLFGAVAAFNHPPEAHANFLPSLSK